MIRSPHEKDAAEIWHLVERCDELDANSPYAYLLLCTDFARTGLVIRRSPATDSTRRGEPSDPGDEKKEEEGALVAFVLGYRPPDASEVLFVWQVGVDPAERGQGLGRQLLNTLVDRCCEAPGIEFLEATVTPSNNASRQLFTNFARDRAAPVHESIAFQSSSFPQDASDPHEDEVRLRIGPFLPRTAA